MFVLFQIISVIAKINKNELEFFKYDLTHAHDEEDLEEIFFLLDQNYGITLTDFQRETFAKLVLNKKHLINSGFVSAELKGLI